MTDYLATQAIAGGAYDGQAFSAAHPTIGAWGQYDFTWSLPTDFDFAALGVIGYKLVGHFDGSGHLTWDVTFANPGYPSAPTWPVDGDSHLGLNNSYDPSAYISVDGPTDYTWVFAVTDTASDPTYGGFSFADPLGDIEISLHDAWGVSYAFSSVQGSLGAADGVTSVQVLGFDLVLYTELVTGTGSVVVTRLWPRDDALGLGTANRLVPAPRANRIIGRQP